MKRVQKKNNNGILKRSILLSTPILCITSLAYLFLNYQAYITCREMYQEFGGECSGGYYFAFLTTIATFILSSLITGVIFLFLSRDILRNRILIPTLSILISLQAIFPVLFLISRATK